LDNRNNLLIMTSSPHVRSEHSTTRIMLDVLIALTPAAAFSVFAFGMRSLVVLAISVACCVGFEWLYCKWMKKSSPIGDLSAAVTGVLLAMNMPASVPLWMPVVGALFAIVLVKQLYGGLGKNIFNPALAARVFLALSWPAAMTAFTEFRAPLPLFASAADAVTSATPLTQLKNGGAMNADLLDLFLGSCGGCIGDVSTLLVLAGGLYLMARKVVSPRIPLSYLGTVALLSVLFPQADNRWYWTALQLCSGGLMLGALFMATDYVTSPVTVSGQWVYGVGCGLLTVCIRRFGAYPEGVSFAILIMNALVWLIDTALKPRRFGSQRFDRLHRKKEKKEADAA